MVPVPDGKLFSGSRHAYLRLGRDRRDVSDSEAGGAELKPCVFIHTNEKQVVGALVAAHALRRNARRPDSFGVRIIHTKDYPWLAARQGQAFKRGGAVRAWDMRDLQSFTPLRFLPPQLMNYQGRAAVIDPDVFALADVSELLNRDMQGRAILCRMRDGPKGRHGYYASSVMLLDCGRLRHWRPQEDFEALFSFERDYMDWISLKLEPPQSIDALETVWNDFDRLTPQTKMLHNTRRITQPWKAGLPIDFTVAESFKPVALYNSVLRLARRVVGPGKLVGRYLRHPDRAQERLFFGLLRECLDNGRVSQSLLCDEMARGHIRHDAFEVLERTRPLAA